MFFRKCSNSPVLAQKQNKRMALIRLRDRAGCGECNTQLPPKNYALAVQVCERQYALLRGTTKAIPQLYYTYTGYTTFINTTTISRDTQLYYTGQPKPYKWWWYYRMLSDQSKFLDFHTYKESWFWWTFFMIN